MYSHLATELLKIAKSIVSETEGGLHLGAIADEIIDWIGDKSAVNSRYEYSIGGIQFPGLAELVLSEKNGKFVAEGQAPIEHRTKITRVLRKNGIENNLDFAARTIIDGKSKQQAARMVNKAITGAAPGFYSDQYWQGPKKVWKALDDLGVDWAVEDNNYGHDSEGRASSKTWKFHVRFINNRGKVARLYGFMVASGAGSVEEPLSKYDVTAYVS